MNKRLVQALLTGGLVSLTIPMAFAGGCGGAFGASSNCTAQVEATIATKIQIMNMTDFSTTALTDTDNASPATQTQAQSVCVRTNGPSSAKYNVTATMDVGAFKLVNQSNNAVSIPLGVYWATSNGVTTPGSATQLSYNTALSAQGNINTSPCSSSTNNASLVVQYTPATNQLAGDYKGTLSVTVALDP